MMPNPWSAIKDKLDEWGEALRRRIMADVLRLIAEVLEAKPTTPQILRAKADALEAAKK